LIDWLGNPPSTTLPRQSQWGGEQRKRDIIRLMAPAALLGQLLTSSRIITGQFYIGENINYTQGDKKKNKTCNYHRKTFILAAVMGIFVLQRSTDNKRQPERIF